MSLISSCLSFFVNIAFCEGSRATSFAKWYFLLFKSTFPSTSVVVMVFSDSYAFTLKLVPVTFTSTPSALTTNGSFSFFSTLKNASPSSEISRLLRLKSFGYFSLLPAFSQTFDPSGKTISVFEPKGAVISLNVFSFRSCFPLKTK